MLIGFPSTGPPKSSIAICAAVTEPWPVGVEAGPFMSVRTPILTTSSETCASAAVDASIAAAPIAAAENFLENIPFPPWSTGALAAFLLLCGGSIALIGPICNYFARRRHDLDLDSLAAAPCLSPQVGTSPPGPFRGSRERYLVLYFQSDSGH